MKRSLIFVVIMMMCGGAHADMYGALQTVYDTNPVIARQRAAVSAARSDLSLERDPMSGRRPGPGFRARKSGRKLSIMNRPRLASKPNKTFSRDFPSWPR